MRTESTKGLNEYKCWLTPSEVDRLREIADDRSHRHKVVVLLGSRVGLRAEEMTWIRPRNIKRDDEAGSYFLHVSGKDTTGEHSGKERDAYLPDEVERELLELQFASDPVLEDDDPYLDVTPTRIRQMVSEAAEMAADMTGDKDWLKVSSHDLRRYFAQTCLVRKGMNPRVVMAVGGWESFNAIEPYLNAPTPENVADAFRSADLD